MRGKKILSLLLSLVTIFGLMAVPAFTETSDTVTDKNEWVYTCNLGKDAGGDYTTGNGMQYE